MRERKCKVTRKKKRVGKYPKTFREKALERMKSCENVSALAKELGIKRSLLYKWRDQIEAIDSPDESAATGREERLRGEIGKLKRVLAEKTLEVDFFKGALHKVEARRQSKGSSGAKASTTKSGS